MSEANWYGLTFKAWRKALGSKPTADMLSTAHAFGKPGKQSLGIAMAMRPEGVTAEQVRDAVGLVDGMARPQNNHRTTLLRNGWFKRVPTSKNDDNHTVYRIELTAKGAALVTRKASKADPEPVNGKAAPKGKAKAGKGKGKGKGKGTPRKPRAPKVAPVTVPVTEPVTAEPVTTEPVTAPTA